METIWFSLVAIMIAMYVVFDGFDLGVGALHLLVARNDAERRIVLRSIGPVWDGNEVWLLAAGGTLFFAFPLLYATSFSGFYLPLMIVLWLLILRGISIEFRHLVHGAAWTPLWDVVFSLSSLLLIVFFGAALGNVVRGVSFDAEGHFFAPLWTHFRVGPEPGVLDWFTVTTGLTALAVLVLHGALWLVLKTTGELQQRAERAARRAFWASVIAVALLTLLTFRVQPQVALNLSQRPWGAVFPALAVGGLIAVRIFIGRRNELRAFLASCGLLIGLLSSAAFGLYPYVLPSLDDPAAGLTAEAAAAAEYGLRIGLVWWIPGMLLVTAYFVFTYRHLRGKVALDDDGY
jgi:cytochrome d ubiquinol oxidase subunit II